MLRYYAKIEQDKKLDLANDFGKKINYGWLWQW